MGKRILTGGAVVVLIALALWGMFSGTGATQDGKVFYSELRQGTDVVPTAPPTQVLPTPQSEGFGTLPPPPTPIITITAQSAFMPEIATVEPPEQQGQPEAPARPITGKEWVIPRGGDFGPVPEPPDSVAMLEPILEGFGPLPPPQGALPIPDLVYPNGWTFPGAPGAAYIVANPNPWFADDPLGISYWWHPSVNPAEFYFYNYFDAYWQFYNKFEEPLFGDRILWMGGMYSWSEHLGTQNWPPEQDYSFDIPDPMHGWFDFCWIVQTQEEDYAGHLDELTGFVRSNANPESNSVQIALLWNDYGAWFATDADQQTEFWCQRYSLSTLDEELSGFTLDFWVTTNADDTTNFYLHPLIVWKHMVLEERLFVPLIVKDYEE